MYGITHTEFEQQYVDDQQTDRWGMTTRRIGVRGLGFVRSAVRAAFVLAGAVSFF